MGAAAEPFPGTPDTVNWQRSGPERCLLTPTASGDATPGAVDRRRPCRERSDDLSGSDTVTPAASGNAHAEWQWGVLTPAGAGGATPGDRRWRKPYQRTVRPATAAGEEEREARREKRGEKREERRERRMRKKEREEESTRTTSLKCGFFLLLVSSACTTSRLFPPTDASGTERLKWAENSVVIAYALLLSLLCLCSTRAPSTSRRYNR